MAESILFSIEGVLSKEGPPNGQPDMTGLRLFHSLRSMFKLVMSTTCEDKDWVDHWLNVVGIRDTHYLLNEMPLAGRDTFLVRLSHYEEAVRLGYQLSLVIDSDPAFCAEVMRRGVVSLLWSHPRYARPEARPDFVPRHETRRSWDEIEQEIDKVKRLGPKIPVDAEMEPT